MKVFRGEKQQASSVGWCYVTLRPYRSPRVRLVVFRHCVRYLTESINFPLTISRRVRKHEGISGGKIAGKIGRVVVHNTQSIPLTSWSVASRTSLGRLRHLFSHFQMNIFLKKHGMTKFVGTTMTFPALVPFASNLTS
jgi:hypothetical protein